MAVFDDEFAERLKTRLKDRGHTDVEAHEITGAVVETLGEDAKLTALVENRRMDHGR